MVVGLSPLDSDFMGRPIPSPTDLVAIHLVSFSSLSPGTEYILVFVEYFQ